MPAGPATTSVKAILDTLRRHRRHRAL